MFLSNLSRCFVPLLLCCLFAGCGQPESGDLPEDLQRTIDTFYASIATADPEARIALLADDVLLLPNHWTVTRGKEAVSEMFRGREGTVFNIRNRTVLEAGVEGSLAYTINSYEYTYHAAGDEPRWHKTKNIHLWKKNAAGQWTLHADLWNSDVPLSEFMEE